MRYPTARHFTTGDGYEIHVIDALSRKNEKYMYFIVEHDSIDDGGPNSLHPKLTPIEARQLAAGLVEVADAIEPQGGTMTDKTIDELLITATACLVEARQGSTPTPALLQESLEALVQVVGRQDARIAALEAARAPHGLPLEGTGPLPLERT